MRRNKAARKSWPYTWEEQQSSVLQQVAPLGEMAQQNSTRKCQLAIPLAAQSAERRRAAAAGTAHLARMLRIARTYRSRSAPSDLPVSSHCLSRYS